MSNKPSYKRLLTVLKLTVFSACLAMGTHYLLTHDIQWSSISISSNRIVLLPLTIAFAFINWGLEAYKWKFLVQRVQNMSFTNAFKATLSGVATSFITPFRVGDFLGRIAHLKNNRKTITVLTFYGNYTQLLTTFLGGSIAFLMIGETYLGISKDHLLLYYLLIGIILLLMSLILLYPIKLYKAFRIESILKVESGLEDVEKPSLLLVLLMSILRYVCFVSQFVFCFWLYGSTINYTDLAQLIALLYLLITFVPSPILGKLGVRESVALFLLGGIEASPIILAASLTIWLINLFIPAMIGSVYLMRVKNNKA